MSSKTGEIDLRDCRAPIRIQHQIFVMLKENNYPL
jgi:hypothetical protein